LRRSAASFSFTWQRLWTFVNNRDRKGLYGKARAGILPQFTGLTDPYEPPTDAEIIIDTAVVKPLDATQQILDYLRRKRYLRDSEDLSCRNL